MVRITTSRSLASSVVEPAALSMKSRNPEVVLGLSSIGLYGPISLPPDVVLRNGMVSAHWIIPVLRRS